MRLVTTYLNHHIELLDGIYGCEQHDELQALLRLYNRVVGPVRSVNLLRPELLDLSIYSAGCTHVPITALIRDLVVKEGPSYAPLPGGGKGLTILGSVRGALGEMAERLLAALHFTAVADCLEYATYAELVRKGRAALGPDDMPLFAPEQYARPKFGFVPFRPDTLLGWAEGRDLLTGQSVLVPAQLVFMYYKRHAAEPPIGFATSAGLAFHPSRRHAILHGLYEVIERDGVNVHWYSRLPPPPRVDVNLQEILAIHFDVRIARMLTPYLTQGVQLFLNMLDLPIPVFTALVVDASRRDRAFQGGSGASSQREWALGQALLEIGQSQSAFHFDDPFGRPPVRADSEVAELTAFFDAPLYFGHAQNLGRLSWYTAGDRVIRWDEVPTFRYGDEAEEYEATALWLQEAGIRPIVLDFDGACWPDASVVKVLVPQLTQACTPSHPFLGHPRFYELPQQLGLAGRVLAFGDLNPDPVPFP